MKFEFATASRIIFGQGTVEEVAPMASKMGNCALLVTGRNVERAGPLAGSLKNAGMKTVLIGNSNEIINKNLVDIEFNSLFDFAKSISAND